MLLVKTACFIYSQNDAWLQNTFLRKDKGQVIDPSSQVLFSAEGAVRCVWLYSRSISPWGVGNFGWTSNLSMQWREECFWMQNVSFLGNSFVEVAVSKIISFVFSEEPKANNWKIHPPLMVTRIHYPMFPMVIFDGPEVQLPCSDTTTLALHFIPQQAPMMGYWTCSLATGVK